MVRGTADPAVVDHGIAMRLRMTMNLLESVSCIKFIPIIGTPDRNGSWLHISNPRLQRDCMHEPLNKGNGELVLVLGLDCLSEQQILHTLLHGVGFKDEVSHPQRDQYIRILWSNIQPAYQHLFKIQPRAKMSKNMIEYDPMSVMHFHDRAFSTNGQATIAPLIAGLVITPSDSLSQLDKMKLKLRFGHECNKRNVDDLLDICKKVLYEDMNKGKIHIPSEGQALSEDDSNVSGNNTNSIENNDQNSKEEEENNPDDSLTIKNNDTLSLHVFENTTEKLGGEYKRVKNW
ncbi:Zinc metalloproteinase nas-15 [Papilio xuthus]|uniref:Metalloendopeptidase n=1 Tax=Papilio xuthus TaxID=66420 RepID=A0A194PZS6_PAPXU|nr:Zinc metalloproteinase nas-15 [Papilio xuthus]